VVLNPKELLTAKVAKKSRKGRKDVPTLRNKCMRVGTQITTEGIKGTEETQS
jgi:hypothetical protein